MRGLRATLVAVLGAATLAACAYGPSSGGGSDGVSDPHPGGSQQTADTDCGYSWKPCASAPAGAAIGGQPDNAPAPQASGFSFVDPESPYDCKLYFDTASGLEVVPNALLQGTVHGTCFGTGSPESVTTTLVLQWFSPRLGKSGEWVNLPASMEQIYTPPLRFPQTSTYTLHGYCKAGSYRIWGKVVGFDNHGVPFNPNTNPKYLSVGPAITFSDAQCAGGAK